MTGLITGLVNVIGEPLKSIALEKTIVGAWGQFQKLGFRKKVIKELPQQLSRWEIIGDRCRYITAQLKQPEALKNIGHITSFEEFHNEIIRWLEYPPHLAPGDPRRLEGELVTAALILAVLKVSSPNQHQAMMAEMQLRPQILEQLPTISQAIEFTRDHQKAPVASSLNSISQVLAKAGQRDARISTNADGQMKLTGPINLTFSATGENARRMQEWLTQPRNERLVLDVTGGSFQLSAGHEELDKILFPGVASHLAFELAPVALSAKLKVVGLSKTKFLDGTLLLHPHENEVYLTLGYARCQVQIIFRLSAQQSSTVNLKVDSEDKPLPLQDTELLNTLDLLFAEGSRLQLLSWVNQDTQEVWRGDKETYIFAMDGRLQEAENFRWVIKLQLLLLELVKLISEKGFNPDELQLPDLPLDDAVSAIQQILNISNAKGIGETVRVTGPFQKKDFEQTTNPSNLFVRHQIDFGSVVVVSEQVINDYEVIETTDPSDTGRVGIALEGKWGKGVVRFLTPQQFQGESE